MDRSVAAMKAVHHDTAGLAMGGGYIKFSGDGSPLTQAYGIGHRGAAFSLEEVDNFYRGLTTNWELIVTPFTSNELLAEASRAGYVSDHFESVLAQEVGPSMVEMNHGIRIEEVKGDLTVWLQSSDAAWSGQDELPEAPSDLARSMSAVGTRRYLAYLDDQPAATASMISIGDRHMFSGAATRPQFRNKGLQTALTQRRMADAGVGSLVHVVAIPGSQSHRNLQRIGFQPLYSKLVMFRNPLSS